MTFTPFDVFLYGVIASAVLLLLRDLFFTKMYTYTYGFSFTTADGTKAFSEVQTQSMAKPQDISFFRLCQQAIRDNGHKDYDYVRDPQFQLAYAMYVNSCWRHTATLVKASKKKKEEASREESTADESADS